MGYYMVLSSNGTKIRSQGTRSTKVSLDGEMSVINEERAGSIASRDTNEEPLVMSIFLSAVAISLGAT